MQPTPIGVPGELYLGGAGVARGYLNRPDLTSERFIDDPFANKPGKRLYRTGDWVRYRPDGNLVFLGRIDHQVKIRGFRIELGEIEAAIVQHDAVREVVVVARDMAGSGKQLVLYYSTHSGKTVTVEQLRIYLQEKLPDYMVPALFVQLPALPLTPNGKVNRKALPEPESSRPELSVHFVAPQTTTEQSIANVWCAVLGIDQVGVYDNFFELGGHSLLGTQVISRLQELFQLPVPLRTIFEEPTIAGLARRIDTLSNSSLANETAVNRLQPTASSTLTPLIAIQPSGSQRPFFCVHPANGQVTSYFGLAHALGSSQPFYGFQSPGLTDKQPSLNDITTMASCYLDSLRAVQPQGPYLLGGWSMGGIVAFEMGQQLIQSGESVAALVLMDSRLPGPNQHYLANSAASNLINLAYALGLTTADMELSFDSIKQWTENEQLQYVMERAKATGKLPNYTELADVQNLFTILKTNIRAMLAYQAPVYPGVLTLLKASESIPGDEILEEDFGWSKVAPDGLVKYTVPGSHYTMLSEANVYALAQQLSKCFDKVNNKIGEKE
jgi:thioesterase domain-containing protein